MLSNSRYKIGSGKLIKRIFSKRMRKFISHGQIIIVLILNLVNYVSNGYSQSSDDVLILDDLIKIAIEKNPQLRS